MSLSIVDIDNAKNKRQLMTSHVVKELRGDTPENIIKIITAFMSIDDLEDAFVTICNVDR